MKSNKNVIGVGVRRLVRKILEAPAPRWMIRMNLHMVSRQLHKCANEMLMIGDEESYRTAVEIRTLAHRVSDSANAAMDLPGDPNGPKTNSDVAAG